jgi:hypothetical protein
MVWGPFFIGGPDFLLHFKEGSMSQKEHVFAKKCALTTRDWDTFQTILRKCLRPAVPDPVKEKGSVKILPDPETLTM